MPSLLGSRVRSRVRAFPDRPDSASRSNGADRSSLDRSRSTDGSASSDSAHGSDPADRTLVHAADVLWCHRWPWRLGRKRMNGDSTRGVLVTPGHECTCDDCLRLRGVQVFRGSVPEPKFNPRNRFERRHGRKLSAEEIKDTMKRAAEALGDFR